MKHILLLLALAASIPAFGQQAWTHNTRQLQRSEVDALLAQPEKVLILDVRRPDEVTAKGSFPVYLSVQAKDVEQQLSFIPKDRLIITVSNHAHRAGAVGDLLLAKGYQVAGATGSEDYEAQGGTIKRITPPPAKISAAPAAAAPVADAATTALALSALAALP
ncbi:rhodanese-like domain-containing protein [Pseudoduganella sp. FT93W]|uniref:Rhodanese-like domain-containing protein n=1 Tax=Duganella fentianensis TaxID=2692177 RepID=A0A845HUX6_9BURK|nr:rhodanese-like domain-containing protein [Duganella fentianensis]MYN44803.1 rhodanese-like domain-containing protein [Duganella fentianensis]